MLRADRHADAVEVPLADMTWRLRLPSGYEATGTGGTLTTDDLPRPEPAAVTVIDTIYWLAGGVHTGGWLFPIAGSHSQVKSAARAGAQLRAPRSAAAVQRIEQEAKLDDETNDQDTVANDAIGFLPADAKPPAPKTALSRALSLAPGDVADVREIRDSERRIKASGLFLKNEAGAAPPKIVYVAPQSWRSPLLGVSSLKIELQDAPLADTTPGSTLTFRSLGVAPELVVTMTNRAAGCARLGAGAGRCVDWNGHHLSPAAREGVLRSRGRGGGGVVAAGLGRPRLGAALQYGLRSRQFVGALLSGGRCAALDVACRVSPSLAA